MDTVSCRIREGVPDRLVYAVDTIISADSEQKLKGKIRYWQEELVNSRKLKVKVMISKKTRRHQAELSDRHDQEIKQVSPYLLSRHSRK